MLHVPTNRIYSWGSTLYGQLGLATLGNNDTINVANIGIGSGNANSMSRRRVHGPTEIVIPGVTGGVDVNVQLPLPVSGTLGSNSNTNKVISLTGIVHIPSSPAGAGAAESSRVWLTYITDLCAGEHHNMILTTSIPLQQQQVSANAGGVAVNGGTVYVPSWTNPAAATNTTPGKAIPPVFPITNVYTWGYNLEGQCGHAGSVMHVKIPRLVDYFQDQQVFITNIYAGLNYSMAIGRPVMEWSGRFCDVPLLLPDRGRYHQSHDGIGHRGINIYGWGYCDGGWLGLVTPPALSLPYIDADNVSPTGYNFPLAT